MFVKQISLYTCPFPASCHWIPLACTKKKVKLFILSTRYFSRLGPLAAWEEGSLPELNAQSVPSSLHARLEELVGLGLAKHGWPHGPMSAWVSHIGSGDPDARSPGWLVAWQSCHIPKFELCVAQVSMSASGHTKPPGIPLLPACPPDLHDLMELGLSVCASNENIPLGENSKMGI